MIDLRVKRIKKWGCLRFILLSAITIFLLLYVSGTGRDAVLKFMYPLKYSDEVEEYSSANNLDKYLVYAVIRTESKFNETAVSDVGAKGLMQLMESTAKECNSKGGFSYNIPKDIYVPDVNISLGCYYLKKLIENFDGDITLAVAAYNGGAGNVGKWLKDDNLSDGDGGLLDIPFKETKGYVDKVLDAYKKYTEIYNN